MAYLIGDALSAGDIRSAERPIERKASIEWLAPLFCFAFGAACLLFVIGPGDGTWILYARAMEAGQRIYSDLALNQQPLFPLLSLAAAKLSTGGLLGDRLIFFGVLAVHALLVFLVSRRAAGSGLRAIILTLAAYFTAIHFEAFRYDDYHAVAQCMVLASLYASMRYVDGELVAGRFALFQGVLAAGAFLTRVNEGLAIAGAVTVIALSLQPSWRSTARLALISALAAATVFASVLLLIGEAPSVWYHQTLVAASEAKGGGALAATPWRALVHAVELLLQPAGYLGDPLIPLTAFALILSAGAFALWPIRWVARRRRPNGGVASPHFALAAYPLFMFAAGALSTGGMVYGLYFPLALALVVGMLVLRGPLGMDSRRPLRVLLYSFLGLIALDAAAYRANNPYSWLSYHVNPLFVDYRFKNDGHGPHVITGELDDLITPVCARVTSDRSLLSLPYSFANYYCGVPAWHGYVQSFFDTSTKSRIEQLQRDLRQDPPDFIFYQRQLPILRLHEKNFAGGRPLPHRDLDRFIAGKVRTGEWTIVYRSAAYPPSNWYLISTGKRR